MHFTLTRTLTATRARGDMHSVELLVSWQHGELDQAGLSYTRRRGGVGPGCEDFQSFSILSTLQDHGLSDVIQFSSNEGCKLLGRI